MHPQLSKIAKDFSQLSIFCANATNNIIICWFMVQELSYSQRIPIQIIILFQADYTKCKSEYHEIIGRLQASKYSST